MTDLKTRSSRPPSRDGGRKRRQRLGVGAASPLKDLGWWVVPVWLVLAALAVSTLYPVVFIAFTAFKSVEEYVVNKLGGPLEATLDNFRVVTSSTDLVDATINSLIVVSVSVLLIVVVSTLVAHVIMRMGLRPSVSGAILAGIVTLMMMPTAVLMVPVFRLTGQLGLFDSIPGLILIYLAFQLPVGIYLMSSYYSTVPPELLQAAHVDGASDLQAFFRIAVPILRPGMLVVAILNFISLWNELLFALLLLPNASNRTLMVTLAALRGQHATPVPHLAVGLLIGMIIPLLVFVFAQRKFAEGLTQGALK